ncbi:alpha/beta hydrolase [Spiribacter salinus]|uniref:alpha/beta hydrolase n=1 Tax=Spiribacter salinus TaxID=1335746 RepID=UPI001C967381|nr:carboxylesterase [Spiribacter salinus]MBY5268639.1 carboxylesterase [Spiribacter salinus]
MTDSKLQTVEVGPAGAKASVLWLHGLGASGHDFEPIVPELGLPADAPVRFVFPHAPERPVTLNGGMVMPAWYDIYGLTAGTPQDEQGLDEAAGWIAALIEREAERGVPAERLVLAGFSQGGAVALHAGLRFAGGLAGIMGLSTYLPLADNLSQARAAAHRDTPIFLAHGEYDGVLGIELGTASRDALAGLGYPVEWHAYPMEHQVCLEEIQAIGVWLRQVLAL